MAWWDFFKVFQYAFTNDPLSRKTYDSGAGTPQDDAIPDLRSGGGAGGAAMAIHTNELVDISTVTTRLHRYKEYERLRNMAEIEMSMTVFADEACVSGDTKVATPTYGMVSIEWLTENMRDERFLVYCWDFGKEDYVLGWAHSPRKTKTAQTIRIVFDDGTYIICTPDHRILNSHRKWKEAGKYTTGDEVIAFHRVNARTSLKNNQFPRVYTHKKGWIHERQFIDEWRLNRDLNQFDEANQYCRMIAGGMTTRQISERTKLTNEKVQSIVEKYGMTNSEIKYLSDKKKESRRIVGIFPGKEIDVYDLSVDEHENFCTDWGVVHNCQRDEDGRVFKIITDNESIKEELEFLLFHRKMLNLDQKKIWNKAKNLFINGDFFEEVVINPSNPKEGIKALVPLPADSMYRIETTKGRIVEFQQSKEGPDYQSLSRVEVTQATDADLAQATAIRFAPEQIVHTKIGDDRKTFYPYGVSLIEAARGPAHQLRLMEDAMVVYRLCLTGDARVRTDKGWKYIKDIESNGKDYVYTLNKAGNLVRSGVEKQVCNGKKKVYRVRSKHIEVKGTATHPILVNRDGIIQYVDIQNLRIGSDRLFCVSHDANCVTDIPRILNEPWAKLSQNMRDCFRKKNYENKSQMLRQCGDFDRAKQFIYTEGKALPLKKAIHICEIFGLNTDELLIVNKGECNSDRITLPNNVDEDFARLFGFMHGDGHIRENQLCFSTGESSVVNERYRSFLENYFGKVTFEIDKRSEKGHGKYVVSSTVACHIFKALGYMGNHDTCRVPEWIFNSPKCIRRAFIEGLSDADGCERYTNKGTWYSTIELSNKGLIEDIKELWSSIGLSSGHIKKRLREGGHKIVLGRTMPASTSYSVTISECLLPDNENVISVEYIGEEDVYDITVTHPEHNFIVNGTCVHNTRAPERRIFYIDVQSMSSSRAEAFVERMKDQFKKKKVAGRGGGGMGASSVEERWHAPAADEDYWIPIRPNNNTRIETLPGAQNLGEIDDTVYFRNKLFVALNFPKNYFNNEDTQSTRVSLSAQDVKFARMIERLQSHMEDAIWEICERHLRLRGYPEDSYEDLEVKMTPPSDWRELSRAEVVASRIQNAGSLKGAQIMSDFDILSEWMKYPEDQVKKMLARLKIQKLEELKLQIVAQNPALLGAGVPGDNEEHISTDPSENNPIPGGDGSEEAPPEEGAEGADPMGGGGAEGSPSPMPQDNTGGQQLGQVNIPEPSEEDIKKYNLDIKDYGQEQDREETDYSDL